MASFVKDNEDLLYYLDKGIDWGPLVELLELGHRTPGGFKHADEAIEFYKESLELVGELVADHVAPQAAAIDRDGLGFENGEPVFPPRLYAIFERIRQVELHGMCLPRELGGQNLPMLHYFIGNELFARADVSVMAHHSFHAGVALALLSFSVSEGTTRYDAETGEITETRWRSAIEEIVRGEAWGSMDITEPHAGSDMAALRCKGEIDAEGRWTVTGQKIFITSGHGKYHFIIARTEQASSTADPAAGLAGLSLFVVPAWQDGPAGRQRYIRVDRLEAKLGQHGSVTCAVSFERAPAELVGKRGEGFKNMLMLMNNARLGVGFESLGLCEAAHRLAHAYAAERRSMGKSIDRHEMIADWLDEMKSDIVGLRALGMAGAESEERTTKGQAMLAFLGGRDEATARRLAADVAEHRVRARRLTPLFKYLAAEKSVEMARRCLQIHGGAGYMREYGAEKLLRDSLVMPIYEGTSQIQALMAMKDTLGAALKSPQDFVKKTAQARWRSLSARDPLERRVAKLAQLSLAAQRALLTRTAGDRVRSLGGRPIMQWPVLLRSQWDPKRDFAFAMLHAERLTKLLCDEAISEILLAQARRHPERREACERYLERAEPRARHLLDEIESTGARLLAELNGESEAVQASA